MLKVNKKLLVRKYVECALHCLRIDASFKSPEWAVMCALDDLVSGLDDYTLHADSRDQILVLHVDDELFASDRPNEVRLYLTHVLEKAFGVAGDDTVEDGVPIFEKPRRPHPLFRT